MEETLIDAKLKRLISACLTTQNYRKLAVIGFTLLSNKANELGITAGLRPRNHEKGENVFAYLTVLNRFLKDNIEIDLIPDDLVTNIQTSELLFLRKRGDIPKEFIRNVFETYYDLSKIEVPNVDRSIGDFDDLDSNGMSMKSSFFSGKRQDRIDPMRLMMMQVLQEKELRLRNLMRSNPTGETMEETMRLKAMRIRLERSSSGKVKVAGNLRDNLTYRTSLSKLPGYFVFGTGIAFLLLGLVILAQLFWPILDSGPTALK